MHDLRMCQFLENLSAGCSISCLIFGLGVLTGWLADIDFLKNPMPGQIPVAPTTAFGFALSGAALILSRCSGQWQSALARVVACIVGLIGALILPTYIFPGLIDLESWFFQHRLPGIEQFAPGRMAPNTAAAFVFSGTALVLLTLDARHYIRAQTIACLVVIMGYFTFTGYLYGFPFLYGIARYTNMALPTGVGFLLQGLAILFYRPAQGLTAVLVNNSTAGFVARRLLPAAILVPMLLGALRVHGQKQGLFEWDFGTASLVVATTIVMLALIGITSRSTAAVDAERIRLASQRDNFMAVLIHDLKNPLIGSARVLEAILDGKLDPLTPKQQNALHLLHRTNQELLEMIKNLLELYRLDRGKETLRFESINILPLLDKTIARFRPFAEADKKYIRTTLPAQIPAVTADGAALEQVVGNLIQNAIKFTPSNGIIEVTAEQLEELVLIKVRDTGKGISAQEQERLFKPFSQGESGRLFTCGTGLGLYLCHQLVTAHKGHLTCISQPDEGTTFVISLPALQQQSPQPAEQADRSQNVQ